MSGVQVLVVDDDRDLLETVAGILDMEGYEVATATNGEEALDYLRAHESPRVILLDLSMPIMDGLTFRDEQRKDAALASIPVVAFSAAAQLAEKVRDHDFAAVLKKPVKLDVLLGTIAKFCPR
jgi:two-component system, chemotaxis family, chemotaxis protein CheY